jgi:ABC-type enterochelin transport system ATPase subunit
LPLTYTRPVCDLRIGILTIREKWEKQLELNSSTITQDYLSQKHPLEKGKNNLLVNGSTCFSKSLLDEITAHLDYVHRHKTFDLLKKLAHNHHKTIILATHEIDLSLKYCDELMVLHDKKIQKIVAAEFQNKDLLNHVFEGLINQ